VHSLVARFRGQSLRLGLVQHRGEPNRSKGRIRVEDFERPIATTKGWTGTHGIASRSRRELGRSRRRLELRTFFAGPIDIPGLATGSGQINLSEKSRPKRPILASGGLHNLRSSQVRHIDKQSDFLLFPSISIGRLAYRTDKTVDSRRSIQRW